MFIQNLKNNGILKASFSYDLIPFEIMKDYAAMDAVVTFLLFQKFENAIVKNEKLYWVYKNLLIEGVRFLKDVESNGVPFDRVRLEFAQKRMQEDIDIAVAKLYDFPEVAVFEKAQGKDFNPNSIAKNAVTGNNVTSESKASEGKISSGNTSENSTDQKDPKVKKNKKVNNSKNKASVGGKKVS